MDPSVEPLSETTTSPHTPIWRKEAIALSTHIAIERASFRQGITTETSMSSVRLTALGSCSAPTCSVLTLVNGHMFKTIYAKRTAKKLACTSSGGNLHFQIPFQSRWRGSKRFRLFETSYQS